MISQSTRSRALTATCGATMPQPAHGEWATLPVPPEPPYHVRPTSLVRHVVGRPRIVSRMLRLLRRHSRVAWALGVVGLLFVVYVVASAPARYQAKGSLVMLNPPVMPSIENRPVGFKANPYAEQGYTGVDVARIVVLRLKSEGEKNYIRQKLGVKGQFDIGANLGVNSTPLVDVTVTGASADQAKAETAKLLQRYSDVLRAIQFEVTPGATDAPNTPTDYPYLWKTTE